MEAEGYSSKGNRDTQTGRGKDTQIWRLEYIQANAVRDTQTGRLKDTQNGG